MSSVYNINRNYLSQGRAQYIRQSKIEPISQQVCDTSCNIPCEQVNLVVNMYPKVITANDKTLTINFIATHTGTQVVNQTIVMVSSLLGNFKLSDPGFAPGQSATVTKTYPISNMTYPTNSITNVSYVALATPIPGGYTIGDRLSKIITTSSDFQSSPSGGPNINSSGEIIDAGAGLSIITMSFTNTSDNNVTALDVPIGNILNIRDPISIIRNPNNTFQITNHHLILAPGKYLLPGVRTVLVIEATLLSSTPYCDTETCMLIYSASSSSGTNGSLKMLLDINNSETVQ